MNKRVFILFYTLILSISFVFNACTSNTVVSSNDSYNTNDEHSSRDGSSSSDESVKSESSYEPISSNESKEDTSLNEAYERDRKIYTDYLLNTRYEGLCICEDAVLETDGVATRMVDLDRNGTYELILSITCYDSGGSRPAQKESLFTITNNVPQLLVSAGDWGGSMGGASLYLVFDTKHECYAIKKASVFRDGGALYSRVASFFTSGTKYEEAEITTETDLYNTTYDYYLNDISKIKSETDIYEESLEAFSVYMLNGAYVTQKEIESVEKRFTNIDYKDFPLDETTYNEPILPWKDIASN